MRSEGSSRLRRISRRKLHMRVVGVKRALHCLTKICSPSPHWSAGQPTCSCPNSLLLLTDVGPVEL